MGMRDDMGTKTRQPNPAMLTIIWSLVQEIKQDIYSKLMGVMKEEGDQGESKHRFEHEELRGWYARRKVLQSVMIPDVEQGENWTGRGHQRSLETD